ncbi:hypothetical protein V6N11_083854 [Hibiscus sabdariffa]|uniref:Disease resistance N-terminal domain-containing protein n=1 Tax=Hibiscus sabdariffa TaxID=183260 RepID=A0ABR2QCQ7_9ROSI
METVAAVGEAFFSSIFEVLLENLNASDLIKFTPKKKELKKWEKTLRGIDAVLADAEEKQVMNRSVKIWLEDLKVLADDANNILDEFAYEELRRKFTAKNNCFRAQANGGAVREEIFTCLG